MARRRMYGSATSATVSAESTRVCAPRRSSASWTRERVENAREHPRVVGGGAIHAGRSALHAANDVPAADDDGDLDAGLVHGDDLAGQRLDPLLVDAELALAAQSLARELEDDAGEGLAHARRV